MWARLGAKVTVVELLPQVLATAAAGPWRITLDSGAGRFGFGRTGEHLCRYRVVQTDGLPDVLVREARRAAY